MKEKLIALLTFTSSLKSFGMKFIRVAILVVFVWSFERWIYTLKNMNLFEQSPFKEEQETFLRLLDVANVNSLSEKERAIYEENLKNYRDWYATIDYAQTEGICRSR